jgi:benzylsuccinate CoA-transferase BbsF subunit
VIKVESRSPLDFMRQGRPLVGTAKDPEQNPVFQNVNRGKLSLCINLQKPGAADVMKDLVRNSDVVIDNFAPGVMDKFGLGWEQLAAVRPDLVMCSMSAAGQHGPLRGIRTYAVMIGALSGLNSMVGYTGDRVIAVQSPPYADPNAGIHAAFGILAALWRRERTGEGAYIDLSQWEAAVNMMGAHVMDYVRNRRVPGTCGTQQEAYSPSGHYPVAGEDKWISITIANDDAWHRLAEALGHPAWTSEKRFATGAQRLANRNALDALLADTTREADGGRLSETLRRAGIPSFPLLDIPDIAGHRYFKERELFEAVAHPILQSVPVYRLPWRRNGNPIPITRRAPYLGEHSDRILREILHKSSADIDALRGSGVLE